MSTFLSVLAALCLLRAATGVLLPEGETRSICDFALGLMETLCILKLLLDILRGGL